jgi:hypothetical protein
MYQDKANRKRQPSRSGGRAGAPTDVANPSALTDGDLPRTVTNIH